MLLTIGLALVAGFVAGNGLPYYVTGSTGDGDHPAPFRDSPAITVTIGWGAFLVAAVAWSFADVGDHPFPRYVAAAVGVLAVGLIHTRAWRRANPWGKRTATPS